MGGLRGAPAAWESNGRSNRTGSLEQSVVGTCLVLAPGGQQENGTSREPSGPDRAAVTGCGWKKATAGVGRFEAPGLAAPATPHPTGKRRRQPRSRAATVPCGRERPVSPSGGVRFDGCIRNLHPQPCGPTIPRAVRRSSTSWSPAPGTARSQCAIAVTNTIRTMRCRRRRDRRRVRLQRRRPRPPLHASDQGLGARGTERPTARPTTRSTVAGGVYRFARDWTNPTLLFQAGGIGALTYDPTNSSLWVSQFGNSTITNYTMGGAGRHQLVPHWPHAEHGAGSRPCRRGRCGCTNRTTQGTFEQWSKSGMLLNRIAVPGMNTQNALGGEMRVRAQRALHVPQRDRHQPAGLRLRDATDPRDQLDDVLQLERDDGGHGAAARLHAGDRTQAVAR